MDVRALQLALHVHESSIGEFWKYRGITVNGSCSFQGKHRRHWVLAVDCAVTENFMLHGVARCQISLQLICAGSFKRLQFPRLILGHLSSMSVLSMFLVCFCILHNPTAHLTTYSVRFFNLHPSGCWETNQCLAYQCGTHWLLSHPAHHSHLSQMSRTVSSGLPMETII